jgi:hypothetical protein
MTLEELDDALTEVFGLDFSKPECVAIRDRILTSYGTTLISEKKTICERCWRREHGKCTQECRYRNIEDVPIEASKEYLGRTNDVKLFPFICLYVIPLYEHDTGERDTLKKINQNYRKRMKMKLKMTETTENHLTNL